MENATLSNLVTRRHYSELAERANEYISSEDWKGFLKHLQSTRSKGKIRDAVVSLLELDAVAGTDSDVIQEFSSLEGTTLEQIRTGARDHAVSILKEQIENRHTYFLDIDVMAMSPYAVLVKDVIEARKLELTQLEGTPSRIDVLGTFYGFTILMIEGSKPTDIASGQRYRYRYRRSWLEEKLSQNVIDVVKQLTGEFGEAVDMDASYKTLGSSRIFKKRCTKTTADILADAVRLTMYKAPGNRGTAARTLGRTEDSRVLPFLHARFSAETNRNVRIKIAHALGSVGHESSIDILKERAILRGRYLSKESMATVSALGRIFSPRCRATLMALVRDGGTSVKAASVQALSMQEPSGLIEIITPYLKNPSKPVVRASVLALMNLGREGKAVIRDLAPFLMTKLISDKTSRPVLSKIFSISGIGKMPLVQKYFSERIKKLGDKVKQIKQGTNRRFSPYYYRRRENRAKQNLIDFLRLTVSCLKPPFLRNLISNIHDVRRIEDVSYTVTNLLGTSELAGAIIEKQKMYTAEQLYL